MSELSSHVRSKLFTAFSSMKNRLIAFYILALIPILVIAYYNIDYMSPMMFGFVLLLLKKDSFSAYREASQIPKIVGIILILGSLIVYYASIFLILLLYGLAATYVAYIIGLFLVFFDLLSLKEAFTPIFIVLAASSISFISEGLESSLSPYIIPLFTSLVVTISNALGVRATIQDLNLIVLNTWRGTFTLQIIWGCVGVYGVLVFSTLMIVVFFEEHGSLKTKTLWAVVGLVGVLVLNIIRVVIIVVADYYSGAEVAAQFHAVLGYILFLSWLAFFLYTFSRRKVIRQKIFSFRKRSR